MGHETRLEKLLFVKLDGVLQWQLQTGQDARSLGNSAIFLWWILQVYFATTLQVFFRVLVPQNCLVDKLCQLTTATLPQLPPPNFPQTPPNSPPNFPSPQLSPTPPTFPQSHPRTLPPPNSTVAPPPRPPTPKPLLSGYHQLNFFAVGQWARHSELGTRSSELEPRPAPRHGLPPAGRCLHGTPKKEPTYFSSKLGLTGVLCD